MDLSLGSLLRLAGQTVRDPRVSFARLRMLDLPRQTLWEALLLVVIVSVILAELGNLLIIAAVPDETDAPQFLSPFFFGGLQFFILVLTVVLIDRVGRAMGGEGRLEDALLAVVWLQFIMVCLQVLQSIFLLILPGLAGLILIGGLGLFLYLMTAFVAELHGFTSMGRTFAMIIFVLIGVALAISFLLSLTGLTVTG